MPGLASVSAPVLLTWMLSAGAVAAVAFQTSRPPGANYSGQAFTFNKIREGVYHAVGTGRLNVGCNTGVIVNDEDVMVVDSHISPAAAWALVEEIRAITPKPVRYVVNTHFHFDHVHGNQVFPPGIEIIGHEVTREMIAAGRSKAGPSYASFVGGIPARLDALRSRATAAADPTERRRLIDDLSILENHRKATDSVVPTVPNVTLNQSMTLYRGGREIRLLFLGRGHTGGDLVVFLPRDRVLISGDLMTAGTNYLGDGYIAEWPETLERLKALDFDVILPGHGQAFTDKARIDHFESYLRDFWSQARALHASRVNADDAARRIDMRAHAAHYPDIKEIGVLPDGVHRAYELIEGQN